MKHVIIAGGAGFIGSHLCEYLLHKGDRVICLDNFRTGHPKRVSLNEPPILQISGTRHHHALYDKRYR